MSEKRFTVMKKFDGSYVICDKGKMLVADDVCDLLNELMEKEIIIVLEDDFGRAMTSIKTELSPPQLLEKIMEWFGEKYE